MIFLLDDTLITPKLAELKSNESTELLDFTKYALSLNQTVYWMGLSNLIQSSMEVTLQAIVNVENHRTMTVTLDKLHTYSRVLLFKYLGAVEPKRDKIKKALETLQRYYKGKVVNPPETILYGLEKNYLLALQNADFPVIHSDIYGKELSYSLIKTHYKNLDKFIIKPLTGELSNSLSLLSDINDDIGADFWTKKRDF